MQGQVAKSSINSDYDAILSIVPKNHILKSIMKILDFSFIKVITNACYHQRLGRPSIDPEIFFRMTLISYLFNIKSDRRLCEEIQCNLLYRWFCFIQLNAKIPHHSSFTRIRARLGNTVFQQIFKIIINKCKSMGIIDGQSIMTDSSLINANASLASLAKKIDLAPSQPKRSKQKDIKIVSNKTHISTTDPEATLARKRGKARALRYKIQNAIDAHSRIILYSTVTTGAVHDSVPYMSQLEKIKIQFSLDIRETNSSQQIRRFLSL